MVWLCDEVKCGELEAELMFWLINMNHRTPFLQNLFGFLLTMLGHSGGPQKDIYLYLMHDRMLVNPYEQPQLLLSVQTESSYPCGKFKMI